MTTSTIKTVATALIIATLGAATLAAPAHAAGQISINYTPTNAKQQKALGVGLQLYSIFKGMSATGGNVSQNGFGNSAGIGQFGSGNHGVIVQNGNGHNGTVQQTGNNNSCGLFQFGQNTNGSCANSGNGQSSLTTVFGF